RWLGAQGLSTDGEELERLARMYGNPRFGLLDYAYVLKRHPMDVWCAREIYVHPSAGWRELVTQSAGARRVATAWLLQTNHKGAQDERLRTRIEADAFARMTPAWRRLGFPFERLVPSYATAIGSSSDRPAALAELMGI